MSGNNTSQGMIQLGQAHSSQTTLKRIVANYTKSYTDECSRRTGALYGTMPRSFEKLLRATDLTMRDWRRNIDKRERVSAREVLGKFAETDKAGQTTYKNLAAMSAEPHPLIETSSNQEGMEKPIPLVSEVTGKITAERYARVQLSFLGCLACRHLPHSGSIKSFTHHKSIVPTALLRTTTTWTLGLVNVMRPLCPSELFRLQGAMIELYIQQYTQDPSIGEKFIESDTPDLSETIVNDIYKSADLGEDYNIIFSPESVMSEYACGVSTYKVVPTIDVEMDQYTLKGRIVIRRPQYGNGQTTKDLESYFINMYFDWEKDPNSYRYKTFQLSHMIATEDSAVVMEDVQFITNEIDQIKLELANDPKIYANCKNHNIVLLEKAEAGTTPYQDNGLTYYAKLEPIKDTLWRHVKWEFQAITKELQEQIENLKILAQNAIILQKACCNPVRLFIREYLLEKQTVRIQKMVEIFGPNSTDHRKASLEGIGDGQITLDDALIIFGNEPLQLPDKSVAILSIINEPDNYKAYWESCQSQIKDLTEKLNNPIRILGDIQRELYAIISNPKYANQLNRLSKVYFALDKPNAHNRRRGKKTPPVFERSLLENPEWSKQILPVTVFYNSTTLYRSFGKNMNIPIPVDRRSKSTPTHLVNCLTTDVLAIITSQRTYIQPVSSMFADGYTMNDEIKAVVPLGTDQNVALFVTAVVPQVQGFSLEPGYYVLPPYTAETVEFYNNFVLDPLQHTGGFVYLGDTDYQYIDLNLSESLIANQRQSACIARVNKSSLDQTIGYHALPIEYGMISDAMETNIGAELHIVEPGGIDKYLPYIPQGSTMETEDINVPNIINLYGIDCLGTFADNLEMFYKGIYIDDWVMTGYLLKQFHRNNKKFVTEENVFIRKREAVSKRLRQEMSEEFVTANKRPDLIIARRSYYYDKYSIGWLDDWSIIMKRFGLPSDKPANPEAIQVIDEMLYRIWNSEMTNDATPINELNKLGIDFRSSAEIDRVQKAVSQSVPDLDFTSGLNEQSILQSDKSGEEILATGFGANSDTEGYDQELSSKDEELDHLKSFIGDNNPNIIDKLDE